MKVLIIEDDRFERQALEKLFRVFYSDFFEVVSVAADGRSGLGFLERDEFDLLMLDINLPDITGIDILKGLFEKESRTTVIMVTAYSDYEHLRSSMRYNSFDYLLKPYSIDSFREAIDRYLKSLSQEEQFGHKGIVQKIKKFIGENYMNSIGLEDIASHVNLDKSYIGRVFKKEEGLSIMLYLLTVRMDNARELLKRGMSVAEVAERVGFSDTAYFGKCFKKYTGTAPSEAR